MKASFRLSALVVLFMGAFPLWAQANTLRATAADVTSTESSFSADSIAIWASNGHSASVTNDEILIEAGQVGIYIDNDSNTVTVGDDRTSSLDFVINGSTFGGAWGIYAAGNSSANLKAKEITISVVPTNNASVRAINLVGATANIDADSFNLSVKGSGSEVLGIAAFYGDKQTYSGTASINAKSVIISAEGDDDGDVRAIHVQNSTTPANKATHFPSVNIIAETIDIFSSGIGASVMSEGRLNLEGNTTITAKDAILARGNAIVRVNESGNYSTVLNGNINFNYDKATSGTTVDADVLVNLTGENSRWNGSPLVSWGTGKPDDSDKLEVDNLQVVLADGAQWNPTIIEKKDEEKNGTVPFAVNNLTLNEGIINITEGTDQVVQVENLTGTGGTINTVATTDGSSISAGQLYVDSVDGAPHFTVNALGISSDDITNQQEALESLYASALSLGDSSEATATLNIAEGTVAGALTAEASSDGVSVTETKNSVNSALIDIASSNYLFFRSSINDVSARMGDLRSMPKTAGAWVRYYGGKNKYSDRNMKEKYNTLQIGGDAFVNDSIYIGGTFSYTDGDGTLKNGSTDDKNYSFGIYGGWIGEKGQFVDVIIKRHRVETDFDLYSANGLSSGSYNNWGTSASVEAGWRLQCPSTGFYAEPQVELQFGRLDSVNYKTSKGVKVEQDGIDSIIGRAGVAVGYTFPENKGTAYAKASVLHDWKGEVESTFSANGVNRTYKDDLGGTWGEFAVGGTYNPTKNLSAYSQVKTSTGSPVRNPWQVSIGLRYSF